MRVKRKASLLLGNGAFDFYGTKNNNLDKKIDFYRIYDIKEAIIYKYVYYKIAIMEKTEVLEKLISKLEISESELENWFLTRNYTNFIPTKLPLVYYRNNELRAIYGLDLNYKKELWGIQLLPGIMVSLTWNGKRDMTSSMLSILNGSSRPTLTWERANKIVNAMRFNGKRGRLPSRWVFKKECNGLEETNEILEENGIEGFHRYVSVWCAEEEGTSKAYLFNMDSWDDEVIDKTGTQEYNMRLAVFFD